jgi:galactoside O-acetyltransferase
MDDFGGDYLIGPIHSQDLTNVNGGLVTMKKFSQLGANTIVFPSILIAEGAVTGSFTLVNKDLDPWTINIGIPVRKIKNRQKGLLQKLNCR